MRPCSTRRLAACAALALHPPATPARAEACPAPPPGIRDLDVAGYYLPANPTPEDLRRRALRDALMTPFASYLSHVVADADRFRLRGDRAAGRCAVAWLARWARDGAWTGTMATIQAEYERKWDVAGYALAYLKVRALASPAERAVIEPWLERLADLSVAFFARSGQEHNNHWYWTGLAVGAVALATSSERLWAIARGIAADAARDVTPDGTLPREIKRGNRALSYHGFSVMPIVLLAELGASRGEDWYALSNDAIHRLVATFLAGLADPALFDTKARVKQEAKPGTGSGWLWLYRRRFPERLPAHLPTTPRGHRWIGGDAVVLGYVLATRAYRTP